MSTVDKELIRALGGPTRVAELLGFDSGGPQRVSNWSARGIPARVKLSRPDIFLTPLNQVLERYGPGTQQAEAEAA
jgi:hypothetical protein